jgi:uncharacterized protein (TIGR02246 family)
VFLKQSRAGIEMMNSMRKSILTLLLVSAAFGQPPKNKSTEARIQLLEDIEAVRNVLIEYGRTLDARDLAAYSQLFAKDGVWSGGFGTVQGPAAIEEFMKKNIGMAPNTAHNYHLLTNFLIDVKGDTATAWSRWSFVVPTDGKPSIAQSGRYDDTLVREDGRWKFKRRVVSNDIPAAGPPPSSK